MIATMALRSGCIRFNAVEEYQLWTFSRAARLSASARSLCGSSTISRFTGKPVRPFPTDTARMPPPRVTSQSCCAPEPGDISSPNSSPCSST